MNVLDLLGQTQISDEGELVERLQSARRDEFGAFILQHEQGGPSLWIHTNRDVAYLHYFLGDSVNHPGFQAVDMTPAECPPSAKFALVGGCEADAIEMSSDNLVSVEAAYTAATEFLRSPAIPASVTWFEL